MDLEQDSSLIRIPDLLRFGKRVAVMEKRYSELFNVAIEKGMAEALKQFNMLLSENDKRSMWPQEWFENRTLVDVLGAYSGNVAEVFNHCVNILDFFLIVRTIKDPVEWQEKTIQAREHAIKESNDKYASAQEVLLADCFTADVGSYMDLIGELEHKAARKYDEAMLFTYFAKPPFAQRGRTEGQSAKRGWAVKVLADLLGEFKPHNSNSNYATIAKMLSDIGDLKTTRQQVRGILKEGRT